MDAIHFFEVHYAIEPKFSGCLPNCSEINFMEREIHHLILKNDSTYRFNLTKFEF